ncbi:MAG: phosphatidate cytidylyltransferase [Acidimicrobiia bacterium]|nr:phosphatidate cytidylyltransferase [Acidimicrobiia bacterium]
MADPDDDAKPAAPEGVRILGAEEAQSALEGESGRVPAGRPRHGDRPPSPDPAVRPSLTFPAPSGPTWSASSEPDDADAAEEPEEPVTADPGSSTGSTEAVPPLPHWSEPPTGAMPAIFVDDEAEPEVADADDPWAALAGPGPRFRAEGSDWAGADYRADLTDETAQVGVAAEIPPDSDATFAEEVAARRRVSTRRTSTTAALHQRPRPDPSRPAPASDAPAPQAGERDVPTAVLTAGIIAVVAFACFNSGTTATGYLSAVILGVATIELAQGLRTKGLKPATVLALLGSVGLVVSAREYGVGAYPVFFGLVTVFSMLWFLWEVTPGRPLLGVATTLFTFGYVGGLGGFAGLLLQSEDGVGLILGVVICTVAYDVFGFFRRVTVRQVAHRAQDLAQQDLRGDAGRDDRVGRPRLGDRRRRPRRRRHSSMGLQERSRPRHARGHGRFRRRPLRVDAQARSRREGLRHPAARARRRTRSIRRAALLPPHHLLPRAPPERALRAVARRAEGRGAAAREGPTVT